MSDIEIGNVWFNRCDGVEAIVKSVGNDCVGFTKIINGKKYFYSHTMEEFKEYYEPKAKADMVNHPPHYKDASGIECIEVTKNMQFCGGNCFKYLYRAGKKGSTIEDLKKAIWYAERACELGENLNQEARDKIREVRRYRELGIQNAMRAMCFSNWMLVIEWIDLEIARLESE